MMTAMPWPEIISLAAMAFAVSWVISTLISQRSFWLRLTSSGLMFGLILGVYAQLGGMQSLYQYRLAQSKQQQVKAILQQYGSKDALIQKLENTLSQQSNSPRGWYLLGRLYMSTGQFANAKTAFAKALAQKPNSLSYQLHWLQMCFTLQHEQFSKAQLKMLNAIMRVNPKQPDALSMLAMHAYQQKNFEKAIDYWQTLLDTLPAETEANLAIRQAIAKAEKQRQ